MEVVTGKFRTLETEINTLLRDAFVHVAGLGHVEESYGAFFLATSAAGCLFQRNASFLGDCLPHFTILASQIQSAIKTINATRRRHLFVVHETPFHFYIVTPLFVGALLAGLPILRACEEGIDTLFLECSQVLQMGVAVAGLEEVEILTGLELSALPAALDALLLAALSHLAERRATATSAGLPAAKLH